jgi:hypothetical protein
MPLRLPFPKALFKPPVVLVERLEEPKALLPEPVFAASAPAPTPVLLLPLRAWVWSLRAAVIALPDPAKFTLNALLASDNPVPAV